MQEKSFFYWEHSHLSRLITSLLLCFPEDFTTDEEKKHCFKRPSLKELHLKKKKKSTIFSIWQKRKSMDCVPCACRCRKILSSRGQPRNSSEDAVHHRVGVRGAASCCQPGQPLPHPALLSAWAPARVLSVPEHLGSVSTRFKFLRVHPGWEEVEI